MMSNCANSPDQVTLPHARAVASVVNDSPDTTRLHYQPKTHVLGDVHPFWHGGTMYLYYLMPGGRYESALAISDDLFHWREEALSHVGAPPERPYFVLGVMEDRDGTFKSYFGGSYNSMKGQQSTDLLSWANMPEEFSVPAQPWFFKGLRDPFVFWNQDYGEYWCIMTGRLNSRSDGLDGAVALSTSTDLRQWQDQDPLFVPHKRMGELEVPQMFKIGDRWYLLASVYHQFKGVGKPSYWSSQDAEGPWKSHFTDSLDGGDLRAAQVSFDGGKYHLMGWIPYRRGNVWGGSLNLPREVYRLEDGSLGTRFDAAAMSTIRGPLLFPIQGNDAVGIDAKDWDVKGSRITFTNDKDDDSGEANFSGTYIRFDLSVNARLDGPESRAGIRIASDSADIGAEIWVDAANDRFFISDLEGDVLTSIAMRLGSESTYPIRAIFEESIIEVNCNETHTLVARLPARVSNAGISLIADSGQVVFDEPRVFWLNGLEDAK